MDKENIIQILNAVLQPQENIRNEAENTIKSLLSSDYIGLIKILIDISVDTMVPFQIRYISPIIIKNSLYSKNQRIQKINESNWTQSPVETRIELIKLITLHLNLQDRSLLSSFSKILGTITRIEIINNLDYDFFGNFLELLKINDYAIGILDTVSHACNQLLDETEYAFENDRFDNKNKIYQIGSYYLVAPNDDMFIYIAMLKCILSSLEVYECIFNSDVSRRDFFARILNFNTENSEISELSLEVINRSIDLYECVPDSEILEISTFLKRFFQNPDLVPMQVFEFYILLIDIEKYDLINNAMPSLIIGLLSCLKKEEIDETEWTPHKGASSLLLLLDEKLQKSLISNQECRKYILDKLKSNDIEQHAIGYLALSCIVGPGSHDDFLYNLIPQILTELEIKETRQEALCALIRICEKDISAVISSLPLIIEKCENIIATDNDCCANAIWVYNSIAISAKNKISDELENIVYFHYTNLLSILIKRLEITKYDDYSIRNALNTTLSELISICPNSNQFLLGQFEEYLYQRIRIIIDTIKNQGNGQAFLLDDCLCGAIILLEAVLSKQTRFDVNKLCITFINCLEMPEMLVRGEVYIAISKLLSHFSIHLKKFMPFIIQDLTSSELFVLKSSLNLLSECATFLEVVFVEYTNVVIPALLTAISSQKVPLDLKPEIIICIGEIALAIGKGFLPYLEMSLVLFSQINSLNRNGDEDYVDNLRKSVMRLFTCIFVSIGKSSEMHNNINRILENVKISVQADSDFYYTKESIELLLDIQSSLGSKCINLIWVKEFLEKVMRSQQGKVLEKSRELYKLIF